MSTIPPVINIDPDPLSGIELLATVAIHQERNVPREILQQIPAETISVSRLVATVLPQILQDILRSPESCFSEQAPNSSPEDLWRTPVPPRTWLNGLEISLAQRWSRTIRSIEVPVGSNWFRFPLWVVDFWLKVIEVIEQRDRWKRAQGWMLTMVRGPEIQEAEKILDRVPWGLRLWPLAGYNQVTMVGFLAGLLSNDWLAERHIDTLVAYLNNRFQKGNQPGTTLIGDQYLGSLLSRKRRETAAALREDRELRTYADKILDGHHERLLFPAHVGGPASGHWIVFAVDIREKTISHGKFSTSMARRSLTGYSMMKVTP